MIIVKRGKDARLIKPRRISGAFCNIKEDLVPRIESALCSGIGLYHCLLELIICKVFSPVDVMYVRNHVSPLQPWISLT